MAKRSIKGAVRSAVSAERKAAKAHAKTTATADSFQNFAAHTGIGTQNQSSFGGYGYNPISNNRNLLEWMYRGSWICGKAVDCIADDMTRAGIDLDAVLKPEEIEKINTAMTTWAVWPRLNSAVKWSRLYGGALAVIMVDGQNLATPLRVSAVGRDAFRGLLVLDRWMVNPSLGDIVQELGPDVGKPKFYDVIAMAPALSGARIHHSRVVRLEGVEMPFNQMLTLNYWGASVLEQLYDRLLAFDSTTQGAAQLVYKSYLRTLKINNLRKIIAEADTAYRALLQQMATMRMFQNNEGVTLVDGEDEFETHEYSFSGLSDTLLQFSQQLSGATGIPLVRLFGQSPAGLNSTGESDLRNYYDNVRQAQELKLTDPVSRVLRVIAMSEGVTLPEGFGFTFRPLWQMTDPEKAEVAKNNVDAVATAEGAGIILRSTALKELRQASRVTGVFSNITDKDISEAEKFEAENPLPAIDPDAGAEPDQKGDDPDGKQDAQ